MRRSGDSNIGMSEEEKLYPGAGTVDLPESKSSLEIRGPLLELSELSVHLPAGPHGEIHAVKEVSLQVRRGERIGIVGESGSGKSVTGRAISGLLPASPRVRVSGRLTFAGKSMFDASRADWNHLRSRQVGMIFQDPLTYLNPVMKVGRQVSEAIPGRGRRVTEAARFLTLAGLDKAEAVAKKFPHELSGGMRQRVLIAIALAKQPDLIIADEPTTALDATVQHRVLSTLDNSVTSLDTSLILISHDLAVVASMTDRIYVMYGGRVVEEGSTQAILSHPQHPYTQALLRSVRSLIEPAAELWSITAEMRKSFEEELQEGSNSRSNSSVGAESSKSVRHDATS